MADERFRKIWDVVAAIPEGSVLNYGEVARLAGLPGRARMVGKALALAPKKLELPWHRVVNAKGEISFPDGSRVYRRQREMLEEEGVVFKNGRIDLKLYGPKQALDRMLWG